MTSGVAAAQVAGSTVRAGQPYTIYPAFCFPKAPTYRKWVKLRAADVQQLRQEVGFECR